MRKRYGKAASRSGAGAPQTTDVKDRTGSAGGKKPGVKEIAWVAAITAGAQLMLDIMRVIREAADLKRHLFPAKDVSSDRASAGEQG
jgi:hypothetical protein